MWPKAAHHSADQPRSRDGWECACLGPTFPESALTLRTGADVASKREKRKAVAKPVATR